MTTFLEKVTTETRERLISSAIDGPELRDLAIQRRAGASPHRLAAALCDAGRVNIIAEIKRCSPSRGVINADIDVPEVARRYETGGAVAISVLTEPNYFLGSLDDLRAARSATSLPILRKDFIVDRAQIYEAAASGADAILLIVAALSRDDLTSLAETAADLGLDSVVEVHDAHEMAIALDHRSAIIGVNNRDLRSLEVSLDVSRNLAEYSGAGSLLISESGITSRIELDELCSLGYNGFLVGETLMRADDAGAVIGQWI